MDADEIATETGWCGRLAHELAAAAGVDEALLTPGLHGTVLALARDVAHATERRNAPVAAFLIGRYLQARRAQGVDTDAALSEVRRVVAALLPPSMP